MASARLKTWLHRIGYVTTVIVLAEAGFLGYSAYGESKGSMRLEAVSRQKTRTLEAPLSSPRELDALAQAASLSDTSGDGIRFVAMPSFYGRWYVVAVHLPAGSDQAQGVAAVLQLPDRGQADGSSARHPLKPVRRETFLVPKADYASIMQRVDALTDGWEGDPKALSCFDGTPVAFERVRAKRITSGAGNESCSDHYNALNLEMRQMLKRYDPQGQFPARDDWMDDPAPAQSGHGSK
jgi:hypothetical protein